MMFSLLPRPVLTKPLCGRGLDTSHVSNVRVLCFLRSGKRNTLRMRKQCVPGPLPALWEGRGYEVKAKAILVVCVHHGRSSGQDIKINTAADRFSITFCKIPSTFATEPCKYCPHYIAAILTCSRHLLQHYSQRRLEAVVMLCNYHMTTCCPRINQC